VCNASHRTFKCERFLKLQHSQVPIVPNNLDCASIVCNHISRVIHVQDKCVISATSDIIHCYIWKEKTKQCTIRVLHQIRTGLQKQGAPQLQVATPIAHTRANPEITFYLQQPLLRYRINWSLCTMQGPVRQWIQIKLHIRKMCTTFEVIQNPGSCIYPGY